MSMEFDAVSKYLLEAGPREWLELTGRRTSAELKPVVSDLSTVTANADKFFRVEEDPPWLVNFEPFSSRDKKAPGRVCHYSILGLAKLELPVLTVVILLSPRADGPEWRTVFQARLPGDDQPYLEFHFSVLRVWELAPEILLKGGIATLALAPISKIRKNEVADVLRAALGRVDIEIAPEERRNYRAAMSTLMGLRYPADFVKTLFKDFSEMRESSVAQLWLQEGRQEGRQEGIAIGKVQGKTEGKVEAKHEALLSVLEGRFGKIDLKFIEQLNEIADMNQLNSLIHFAATDRNLESFVNRIPRP